MNNSSFVGGADFANQLSIKISEEKVDCFFLYTYCSFVRWESRDLADVTHLQIIIDDGATGIGKCRQRYKRRCVYTYTSSLSYIRGSSVNDHYLHRLTSRMRSRGEVGEGTSSMDI